MQMIPAAATDLIDRYGSKARQHVVDQMIAAIRNHDIEAAKHWEHVGEEVDTRLKRPDCDDLFEPVSV